MIDVIGKLWLDVAQRIVGQSRKMQHSLETFEIIDFDVSRVLADGRHMTDFPSMGECAARVKIAVKTNHFVSRLNQHRRENCANVAQVSCHQYPHSLTLPKSNPSLGNHMSKYFLKLAIHLLGVDDNRCSYCPSSHISHNG